MIKPYLIIPQLIEQPTWGGTYIAELKGWHHQKDIHHKIGQSYELTGTSRLSYLTDSSTEQFASQTATRTSDQTILLSDLMKQNPDEILGPGIGKMPLLIKINQAMGNSFQLHVKPGTLHPRWKPKPESWYFLEPGYISCGIKPGAHIDEYKATCHAIDAMMKSLSQAVKAKTKTVDMARLEAKKFIQEKNPWQFINRYETQKYDVIDLSAGGVHHSWEEYMEKFPQGNIVYEVQLDVMDPECTIRSFDQGKMKDDGSIREIHIDDYFQFLDTDPSHNDIETLRRTRQENNLLHTSYYSVDILEVSNAHAEKMTTSFQHLYVRDGDVTVQSGQGEVHVTRGHSCFIPFGTREYLIKANTPDSVILKTYIEP